MGTQCQQFFETPEQEITTALGDEDYDPSIRELKILLLKKVCNKSDFLVLKIISNEEFENQLKNKPKYYRIMNQLKDKIHQISFDSPDYQNICPFKITNVSDGETQYYKGSFDLRGECIGEGIWLNNYIFIMVILGMIHLMVKEYL